MLRPSWFVYLPRQRHTHLRRLQPNTDYGRRTFTTTVPMQEPASGRKSHLWRPEALIDTLPTATHQTPLHTAPWRSNRKHRNLHIPGVHCLSVLDSGLTCTAGRQRSTLAHSAAFGRHAESFDFGRGRFAFRARTARRTRELRVVYHRASLAQLRLRLPPAAAWGLPLANTLLPDVHGSPVGDAGAWVGTSREPVSR